MNGDEKKIELKGESQGSKTSGGSPNGIYSLTNKGYKLNKCEKKVCG